MSDLIQVLKTWKWLIRVLRELKMTHPSLERVENDSSKSWRLENDSSKSWEIWKWLIRVLRELNMTHPSLSIVENDSSKSWEDLSFLSSPFLKFPGSLKIRKQKMNLSNDDNSTSGMAIPICAWSVFWHEQMDGTYDLHPSCSDLTLM